VKGGGAVVVQGYRTDTQTHTNASFEAQQRVRVIQYGEKLGNREGDSAARERTASCPQTWSFWCMVLDRSKRWRAACVRMACGCVKNSARMRW